MNISKNNSFLFTILIVLAAAIVLIIYINLNGSFWGNYGEGYVYGSFDDDIGGINYDKIENFNPPGQNFTDITHYTIYIELDIKNKIIYGKTTIKGKTNKEISSLPLNFYEFYEIISITLNGKQVKYEYEGTSLTLKPETSLSGAFEVAVEYKGSPEQRGLGAFVFYSEGTDTSVYTLNEPVFASTWFPCEDTPDDKALLDITIAADSSYMSLSNGVLTSVKDLENGKRAYSWKTYYPISTYLVAFYTSDYVRLQDKYVSITGDTLALDYYATPGKVIPARKDFALQADMLRFLENTFGPYPFLKEKYAIAEFEWNLGAMEHQTITGMGSVLITGSGEFADVYLHELAHHWWGNAVGPETWKDIWLNEGFSSYSEALYMEDLHGKKGLDKVMKEKISRFDGGPVYDPEFLFSEAVYDKGAWILHMLRSQTGDSLFFAALRNYYETFKYKNADTRDFIGLFANVTGFNSEQFYKQWLFEGEGVPEIEYWIVNVEGSPALELRQVQKGYQVYEIPVEFLFVSGNNKHTEKFFISSRDTVISLNTGFLPGEIIPDPQVKLLAEFAEIVK